MTHKQTFLVTVTSDKPISDLGPKISNRMWTMDTVTNVETFAVVHLGGKLSQDEDGNMVQTSWATETVGEPM